LRLLIFSLPFTAVGSYRLFFTLKPFQIIGVVLTLTLFSTWLRGLLPRRRKTSLDLPLVLFVVIMLVSITNSGQVIQSWRMFFNYSILIVLTLMLTGWYDRNEVKNIPRLLVWGAALMAPFQIINLFLENFNRKYIPVSTFEGGYTTGDYLIFVLPFVFVYMISGKYARWLKALLVALLLFDLILTYNRAAWLSGVFIMVMFLMYAHPMLKKTWRTLLLVVLLGGCLLTATLTYSDYFVRYIYVQLYWRLNPVHLYTGGAYPVAGDPASRGAELHERVPNEHWRFYRWRQVVREYFLPHWFIGSGIGNIGLPLHNPPAHNNGLQIAGETGIVGLSIFVWLYLSFYRAINQALTTGKISRMVFTACTASMGALIIHGYLHNTLVLFHFWALLSFGVLLNSAKPRLLAAE